MAGALRAVTLQPTNGRIWPLQGPVQRPAADAANGTSLAFCLATPSSKLHPDVRPTPFTAVCLDEHGNYLATVDKHGVVHSFHLRANRYVRLDKAGSPGTSAVYHQHQGQRTLYVAFQVRALSVVVVVVVVVAPSSRADWPGAGARTTATAGPAAVACRTRPFAPTT